MMFSQTFDAWLKETADTHDLPTMGWTYKPIFDPSLFVTIRKRISEKELNEMTLRHSKSISGLKYRAIQYGPVPEHYDTIYDNTDGLTKESIVTFDSEKPTHAFIPYSEAYDLKAMS